MAEPGDETKPFDIWKIFDPKKHDLKFGPRESADETRSRLKIAEAEVEHKHRTEAAEDSHRRRISVIVHVFVMVLVAIAFGGCLYFVTVMDSKTGLPAQALTIIAGIVSAGLGFIGGKISK
jgi:hypothetical protein